MNFLSTPWLHGAVLAALFGIGLGLMADFNGHGLIDVPVGVDPSTTQMSVMFNAIKRVEADTFQELLLLRQLWMNRNEIIFIDDEAFASHTVLEMITVDHNPLMLLPSMLGWVEVLPVAYYQLYLSPTQFHTMKSLKWIRMTNCGLTTLPYVPIDSPLMYLDLSDNPMESVPDLSQLNNFVHLELDTEHLHCDWRMCWMLFEDFDISTRTSFSHIYAGGPYGPRNDLETTLCQTPTGSNGMLVKDHTPIQMECYKSKYITKGFDLLYKGSMALPSVS